MKVQTGWKNDGVVRRVAVLGLCFALFSIQPTLGGAAVVTHTFAAANLNFDSPIAEFFDYTDGVATQWTDIADFDAGSYAATNGSAVPGSVVLERIGPAGVGSPDAAIDWWDTAWTNRRCFEIDHTATDATTVTEYQLRLPFPIEQLVTDGFVQPDLGDLRMIGADGVTALPLWPDDTEPDVLWTQVDTITAGATGSLCLYYGYAPGTATAPANHTEDSVFSYTTAQTIYYTVSDVYGAGTVPINVISFVPSNEVTRDDGTTVSLAATGDTDTFEAAGNAPGSSFDVLGPISAAGSGDGVGSLVPISFAGTSFISPINRDSQQFSFVAPFGDAAVTLYDGATAVATFTVVSGTPYTHSADDISPGNTALIESDRPVLVTHRSDLGGDATALYPAVAGDFFAVRSGNLLLGYNTDGTTVAVSASDGATSTAGGDRGNFSALTGGATQGGGSADGIKLTAAEPVGVAMHEDGDGNESVTAMPSFELGSSYWIPAASQYVAFVCPTAASADVDLTVTPAGGGDRDVTCSGGPDAAWAADTADLALGTQIVSDDGAPFAAYYEDSTTDDQVMLLGIKQARQYTWPEPVVTPGTDEGIYEPSGTWESATVDTGPGTAVFGLLNIDADLPAATSIRIQVATAASGTPSSFVGPDGTAATYFTPASLPAVLDFDHDGDRFVRVSAELSTSDPASETPQLNAVAVEGHLPLLDRSLGTTPIFSLAAVIEPGMASSFLLRVRAVDPGIIGSAATVIYRGGTNEANLGEETVRFRNDRLGVDSVQQSSTQPLDPPLVFQSDRPHSVVLDHASIASGTTTLGFSWQLDYAGEGSIFLETDFAVAVIAP